MNEQLANALGVLVAAFLTALTPTLVLLAQRAGKYLASLAQLKLSEKQQLDIKWAVETGIAAAEERGRKFLADHTDKGALKLEMAKATAKSLAPQALSKLDDKQLEEVVVAGVARLRPSLADPGVTSSVPPMGLPSLGPLRAPRVPSDAAVQAQDDEPLTPSERPSAKRLL